MAKTGFHSISNDLLHYILSKLEAVSFSFAACVSKSWNQVCSGILSTPKLCTTISVNPDRRMAAKDALDQALSKPIRPHFVVASVIQGMNLEETLQLIVERVGPRVPIVVSHARGYIATVFTEARLDYLDESETHEHNIGAAILLTIGYVPGLKVDVIPLIPSNKGAQENVVDNFVVNIRSFVAAVSDCIAPIGIMMFMDVGSDHRLIIEKLDYAMPSETVIVGDERSPLLYRSTTGSQPVGMSHRHAAALVFARERNKPHGLGEIRFHAALSKGVSAIGSTYKAASVRIKNGYTVLTARTEGQQGLLDGQQMLENIDNELVNVDGYPDIYIGVAKRKSCSIRTEKPKLMNSLVFYGGVDGDEDSLLVEGTGIETCDCFQFYHSDPNIVDISLDNLTANFKDLKSLWEADKTEAFGGFVFSCVGRGDQTSDSSPLSKNFPDMPVAGILCGGAIGRECAVFNLDKNMGENYLPTNLHVYSAVYLVMSYTPTSQGQ